MRKPAIVWHLLARGGASGALYGAGVGSAFLIVLEPTFAAISTGVVIGGGVGLAAGALVGLVIAVAVVVAPEPPAWTRVQAIGLVSSFVVSLVMFGTLMLGPLTLDPYASLAIGGVVLFVVVPSLLALGAAWLIGKRLEPWYVDNVATGPAARS